MVRSLFCAAFLVLAGILPAAAQPDLAGTFHGTIRSGDAEVPVVTIFSEKGGDLVGKYTIEDPNAGAYSGTIKDVVVSDTGAATMVWTDKYGSGGAKMAFADDGGSFTGKWYLDGQVGGVWNGTRTP